MSEKIATPGLENQLLASTAQIVAAFVGRHALAADELPGVIAMVHQSLSTLEKGGSPALTARPDPAVSIRRSVTPEYIVCLEDGKKLKMLKRHLRTTYNMSPEQYRERWNLPADYPMVAPNYAKQRSKLARQFGLGTLKSRRKKAA